jgi:hypothetical protein
MDEHGTRFSSIWTRSPEDSDDWLAASMMAPYSFNLAVWGYWAQFSEMWWKNVFTPNYCHEHEHNCQLEVPDPIEEEGEHDLFA